MSAIQQMMLSVYGGIPRGEFLSAGDGVPWTVPAGVTSVSILCIQEGGAWTPGSVSNSGSPCRVLRGGTTLCQASNGARIGTGGGDGGQGGLSNSAVAGGGGGAGGYSGTGGNAYSVGVANDTPGTGGGGGGGTGIGVVGTTFGQGGGGVGRFGAGSNGTAAGGGGSGGSNGAASTAGAFGGGLPGFWSGGSGAYCGGRGGALSWINNVAVTPGESLTIQSLGGSGTIGADNSVVRILWGPGRAFPSTDVSTTT